MNRVLRAFPSVVFITVAILVAGCVPSTPAAQSNRQPTDSPRERVLTASIETEPNFIAGLAPAAGLGATDYWQRMFNAFLDLYPGEDQARPSLAEALPALNPDTGVVFPDGKREPLYPLKPILIWQDGAPLTADDFV